MFERLVEMKIKESIYSKNERGRYGFEALTQQIDKLGKRKEVI